MEALFGLPLLDRSNHKKVIFTEFGKTVLATSNDIFPKLNEMMSKASAMASPLSGPLRLMAFPFEINRLDHKIFYEEKFFCAMPAKINGKTYDKKKIKQTTLKEHNILLLDDGHCLRDHALSACQLDIQKQDQTLKATSLQTLIQMVAQGYGVTLLPEMVVKSKNVPKTINLVPFHSPAPTRQIGVAWRPKDPLLDNINAVTQELKKTLERSI